MQVLLDDTELTPDVGRALRKLGAEVELSSLEGMNRMRGATPVDARLIVTADAKSVTNAKLERMLQCFDGQPCATLVLSPTAPDDAVLRAATASGRAIGFATNLSQDDLTGRLAAMCGLRAPMDTMRRELEGLRRREMHRQADLRRLDDERRLAGLMQRELLPTRMPSVVGVEVSAIYRPVDVVSGDLYDVFRLDDSHVAIALIDATGHGLAAALLAAHVRRVLHTTTRALVAAHEFDPKSALESLNDELAGIELQDCQFVTALLAIYDEKARVIRWARGGGSYPILVRLSAAPRQIKSGGAIVGAEKGARFETVELRLEPGDHLIFHTDGLESLLLRGENELGCCDLHRTDWFRTLGSRAFAEHLTELEREFDGHAAGRDKLDDLTLVALHAPFSAPFATTPAELEASLAGVYL